MKEKFSSRPIDLLRTLYIPHGSDERFLWITSLKFLTSFISHMVQMKEQQQAELSLISSLYIPHGSDERYYRICQQLFFR